MMLYLNGEVAKPRGLITFSLRYNAARGIAESELPGSLAFDFARSKMGEVHGGSKPQFAPIAETMGKIHFAGIAGEVLERQNRNPGAIRPVQESADSALRAYLGRVIIFAGQWLGNLDRVVPPNPYYGPRF